MEEELTDNDKKELAGGNTNVIKEKEVSSLRSFLPVLPALQMKFIICSKGPLRPPPPPPNG